MIFSRAGYFLKNCVIHAVKRASIVFTDTDATDIGEKGNDSFSHGLRMLIFIFTQTILFVTVVLTHLHTLFANIRVVFLLVIYLQILLYGNLKFGFATQIVYSEPVLQQLNCWLRRQACFVKTTITDLYSSALSATRHKCCHHNLIRPLI